MSIMEDIYRGKINPSAQIVPEKESDYWKTSRRASQLLTELERNISGEAYEKVNELCDCLSDCQDDMCLEFYKMGFSMGLFLMKDAVENPYLPKENE